MENQEYYQKVLNYEDNVEISAENQKEIDKLTAEMITQDSLLYKDIKDFPK